MADQICGLYCVPPIVVARLGGSTTPLAAYAWAEPSNPRTDGDTVIVPAWSLDVLQDGTPDPFMPPSIRFRDGALLRPICPFVEVWARVGDPAAAPSTWRDAPVTPDLLAAEGASTGSLQFTVEARNLKARRRTGNPDLAYGNFEGLTISGSDHAVHTVHGVCPPGVANPMIPLGKTIPLGAIQVLRPRAQPAAGEAPWAAEVDVSVVRLRFTPAAGLMYGPPQAAATTVQNGPAVQTTEAFLNPAAGWFGNAGNVEGFVIPGDTFDTRTDSVAAALGVIDDTCEVRITVSFGNLAALASVFSAPPDFAPDRRPVVSIADELNDRDADSAARNAALGAADLEAWVADLFARAYDVVSLLNVDFWRTANDVALPAAKLGPPIAGDGLPDPRSAMGGEDALRNQTLQVGAATAQTPLPLADHARERHRDLANIETLRALVQADPQRLRSLVRGPFESERLSPTVQEGLRSTTMRMPPFMAQSTPATPLTLTAWQYDLLMRWADAQQPPPPAAVGHVAPGLGLAAGLSDRAEQHRAAVLQRLDAIGVMR